MPSPPAISVERLSKAYRIGLKDDRADTLVGAVQGLVRAPFKNFRRLSRLNTFKNCDESDDTFWALRDVSFDVAEGEVVGIIGRNGAGKSTLLKILSRITEPTAGRAVIRGRVSSLLEVGTGFHQELSGRENVYMNGTILGMTKREIDRKFDEIVDFSGVEKFLDTPIKHYSSGMKVRLAFSVAAHLEPEILIIDEVLAVGDAEFQKKCLGKMHDVAQDGRTVLFVSHNMGAVQALCSRAILMNHGELQRVGDVDEIVGFYHCAASTSAAEVDLKNHRGRSSNHRVCMHRVRMISGNELTNSIPAKGPLTLEIDFDVDCAPFNPILGLIVRDSIGVPLFGINNRLAPGEVHTVRLACGTIRCYFPSIPLAPGKYTVDLYFGDARGDFDVIHSASDFEITPARIFANGNFPHRSAGPFLIDAEFTVSEITLGVSSV